MKEVGAFHPKMEPCDELGAGDVGYIVSTIKATGDIKIGDTITHAIRPATEMLPGYKEVHPMVYCGLYPLETQDYEKLKSAVAAPAAQRLGVCLPAGNLGRAGFGFRCGFLGLLHMEIIQERIRREHDVDIISTYPSVVYKVKVHGGRDLRSRQSGQSARSVLDPGDLRADASRRPSTSPTPAWATSWAWSWRSGARAITRPRSTRPGSC